MSKLFEDAGKGQKRKWQCFVCGKQYPEFEAYKEHIVTEHDEGREYIKCPADDCGAPVRDLRTHWKLKHPKRIMPKNCQMKVVVWSDFAPNGKKKKTKTRNRQGYFPSKKNGKDIYYRSGLEADFYECLERDKDVMSYEAEAVKVPYYWKGEWHNYITDLLVEFADGSKEIWEVKPSQQTDYDQNKAKWTCANNYCENVGIKFIVQTEIVLDKYRMKLKRQGS